MGVCKRSNDSRTDDLAHQKLVVRLDAETLDSITLSLSALFDLMYYPGTQKDDGNTSEAVTAVLETLVGVYRILRYHPIHINESFMQHDCCATDRRYTGDYLHQKISSP